MGKIRYVCKRMIYKNNYDVYIIFIKNKIINNGDIKIVPCKKGKCDLLYVRIKYKKDFINMLNIIKENGYKNVLIPKIKINKILINFIKNNDIDIDIIKY